MKNWTIVNKPGRRVQQETRDAINAIAELPLDKAVQIPNEEVARARAAARYYSEENPGFIVKTMSNKDGSITLWREEVEAEKKGADATLPL